MAIIKQIKERSSVVYFDQKEVSQAMLNDLIEAARWAPSGFNN